MQQSRGNKASKEDGIIVLGGVAIDRQAIIEELQQKYPNVGRQDIASIVSMAYDKAQTSQEPILDVIRFIIDIADRRIETMDDIALQWEKNNITIQGIVIDKRPIIGALHKKHFKMELVDIESHVYIACGEARCYDKKIQNAEAFVTKAADRRLYDYYIRPTIKKPKADLIPLSDIIDVSSGDKAIEAQVIDAISYESLCDAILAMSKEDQEYVTLFFIFNIPYEVIAAAKQVSVADCKARIRRIRAILRRDPDILINCS
jgi:hypothetical protein